jgi:two-component system LytT family response regulator
LANYCKLVFAISKKLLVAKFFKWFDVLLGGYEIIRTHRSHLINLSCINSYNNNKQHKIILQNQEEIDISRRKRSSIIKKLAIMPPA